MSDHDEDVRDSAAAPTGGAVAAGSAAAEGLQGGRLRADRSDEPVGDSSHTGRLADAYATGPADEASGGALAADDASATADAYADGPRGEVEDDGAAAPSSLSALVGERGSQDDSIGHVFDQTNGVIEGIEGDSDGTARSDTASGAEREYDPDLTPDDTTPGR